MLNLLSQLMFLFKTGPNFGHKNHQMKMKMMMMIIMMMI